jgi:NTE family protein
VLGSGGPRGFAHVGALAAFEEMGLSFDLVVGSSVGAIAGALLASGMRAKDIRKVAASLTSYDLLDFQWPGLFKGEFYTGRAVADLTLKLAGVDAIEALPTPFAAVATKLPEMTQVAFTAGDLRLAIQASVAIAGRAAPVRIGDSDYCDGDLAASVPVRLARQLGAKQVVAVDVSAWDEDTPEYARTHRPDWMAEAARRRAQTQAERPASNVYLHLRTPYLTGFSPAYREQLFKLGYEQVRDCCKALGL